MHLPRRHRQALCRWLVGVLLAVQWLVVSHACQAGVVHGGQAAVPDCHKAVLAVQPSPAHQAAADAPSTPGEQALCKAHCTAGQQLPADAPAAHAAPQCAGWCLVQALPPLAGAAVATPLAMAPALGGAPPPGWPPLFMAHGVLRN